MLPETDNPVLTKCDLWSGKKIKKKSEKKKKKNKPLQLISNQLINSMDSTTFWSYFMVWLCVISILDIILGCKIKETCK